MLFDFRFVLKGPCYNPMDVLNCLFSRRGYKVNDLPSIFCLFIILPTKRKDKSTDFHNKWNGSLGFLKTRIDLFLSQVQGAPQQRTLPNIHNKDDKWACENNMKI